MKWTFNKYPVIRQYDALDCAPAALLSVLRYYKGNASLVYIRSLCKTDRNGTRMLDLVAAAESIGFKALGAHGGYEDLIKQRMPCIAHVILKNGLHHYVVIYKIKANKVFVGDPGRGRYWMKKDIFLKIWRSGNAVLFEPKTNLLMQNKKRWQDWLLPYVKNQGAWLEQALFIGLIYTVLSLAPTLSIRMIIDRYIPDKSAAMILQTGVLLSLILCLRALLGYLRSRFLIIMNRRISTNVANDFLEHLFCLPKQFFDTRKTGDIISRLDDSLKIQEAVLVFVNTILIDGLVIIASLALLFHFSMTIGLLSVLIIPFYGFLVWVMARKIRIQHHESMQSNAQLRAKYIDTIQGYDTLLNFNGQESAVNQNKQHFNFFQRSMQRLRMTQACLGWISESFNALLLVGVLCISGVWVIDGIIELGEMIAVYSLISFMIPSINSFAGAVISLEGAKVAASRLMDLLLIEQEKKGGHDPDHLVTDLAIKNLAFTYPKSGLLFDNLTIKLKPGLLYGIWGNNGCGKSTLIQLLQAKYKMDSGTISFNNRCINDLDLWKLRKRIAVVNQQCKVFDGTLLENILCGRMIEDIDKLWEKLAVFGLDDFVNRFPNGLFTLVGEDARHLSGGEQQLLGICRALLEFPPILVVDEGFSAVDMKTREEIYEIIKKYSEKNIVLLISHDLNLLIRTDYLYHFGKNGVDECGYTVELLNRKESLISRMLQSRNGNICCEKYELELTGVS